MAEWSFTNLTLGDVQPQRPDGGGLPPGRHVCYVGDAKVVEANGGKQLVVNLNEITGIGSTKDYISIVRYATDDGNKLAQRIGRERLKALLTYSGHENPDNPKSVASLKGLVVGVVCERSEDWVDDEGETRRGGVKPKRNGAYFPPAELGYTGPTRHTALSTGASASGSRTAAPTSAPLPGRGAAAAADLDDEIPF